MTKVDQKPSRLTEELLEMADGMLRIGILDPATHERITVRDLGRIPLPVIAPLSGDDIKGIREKANLSQAVFAGYLHLTTGYVSQLERGVKRPAGPALVLLDVIRRKGIEAIS